MAPYDSPCTIETLTGIVEAESHAQAKEKANRLAWDRGAKLRLQRGIILGYGHLDVVYQSEEETTSATPLTFDEYQCAVREGRNVAPETLVLLPAGQLEMYLNALVSVTDMEQSLTTKPE